MGASPTHLCAGLDVGATKVALIVAGREPDGSVHYVEAAYVEARGLRDGVVVDLASVTEAVEQAVYLVEERLGRRLPPLCLAASGRHLQSQNLRGEVTIAPLGREITSEDITRAIAASRGGLRLGENRELLHEIPRAYMVDDQVGVQDPRGMAGHSLDVEVHYVSAAATTLQNLLKCVRQGRGMPELVVAAPLAAAEAVRDAYSDAQCLAVADIGADITCFTIAVAGSVWLSEVIAEGGNTLTRELAAQFKLPTAAAEELKLRHGHCDPAHVEEWALVELPEVDGIPEVVPRAEVARVLQQRVYRFADLLAERLEQARELGVEPDALVLTGGAAALPGLDSLLAHGLDLPVYRGTPSGIEGLPSVFAAPSFSTAAGLVLWQARYAPRSSSAARKQRPSTGFVAGLRRAFHTVLP